MDVLIDFTSYVDQLRKLDHLNKQNNAYEQKQSGSSSWVDSRTSRPVAKA